MQTILINAPVYYNPAQVGDLYVPRTAEAVEAGSRAGLTSADTDRTRTVLLLVDAQVDFIHPDGALSVPGAVDDTRHVIEWIYRNVADISLIAASLDSHIPIQIFSPAWWADETGNHPAPYTTITSAAVRAGQWRPLYEIEWSEAYVETLEAHAKKALMIWPYHTLIGTPGHGMMPALYEALAYHSAARRSPPAFLTKGSIPKTEHYSILEPEVKVPEIPSGSLNVTFLNMLASYDRIYIAGQAKSHCVLETVTSMMRYFAQQPEIIAKLRVLIDCTSSVVHPVIDFDQFADEQFQTYADAGLRLIRSTDPIE